eukprot:1356285-Pleurochrysis_carterae.AAC.1
MQMPKLSSSTDEHVVKVFLENAPRSWVRSWLTELGWHTAKESTTEVLQMHSGKPKVVGMLAGLHELSGRKFVYMGTKLYKPAKEPRARSALTLVPPAQVTHRTRPDRSTALEITFNLAIVNEVCARRSRSCCSRPSLA